ncbi:MAG: hypothetical protein AAF830_00540, partial [Pseudomonadota bacterium]
MKTPDQFIDFDQFFEDRRSSLLSSNFRLASFVSVVNALIIWIALTFGAGASAGSYWLVAFFAVHGARGILLAASPQSLPPRTRHYVIMGMTAAAGLFWPAPLFLLPEGADPAYAGLIVMITVGMTAAASHSYSARPSLAYAFIAPPHLLMAFYYIQIDSLSALLTLPLIGIYSMGMVMLVLAAYRQLQGAFRNEWEAEQRRADLAKSQGQLSRQIDKTELAIKEQEAQIAKIRRLNTVLDSLFKKYSLMDEPISDLFRDCIRSVSQELAVDRVSIWNFDPSGESLSLNVL